MEIYRLVKKLPKRLFIRNDQCYNHLSSVASILNETALVLENLETPTGDGPSLGPFDEAEVKVIRRNTIHYMSMLNEVTHCVGEFVTALDKTEKWLEAMPKNLRTLEQPGARLGTNYNFTHEAQILEQDERDVRELYHKYINARTKKLSYLEHFKPDDQSSTVLSNINTFVERIEDRLTGPLRMRILVSHLLLC